MQAASGREGRAKFKSDFSFGLVGRRKSGEKLEFLSLKNSTSPEQGRESERQRNSEEKEKK